MFSESKPKPSNSIIILVCSRMVEIGDFGLGGSGKKDLAEFGAIGVRELDFGGTGVRRVW